MKKMIGLIVFLSALSPLFGSSIQQQVRAGLAHSPTLEKIIEIEKPSAYQANAMRQAVKEVVAEAQKKHFASMEEFVLFVNGKFLKDPEDTSLVKDVFPVDENTPAKGSADCDSLSLLTLSVWEMMGKPYGTLWMEGIYHYKFGHALLTDGKQYYEMTLNEVVSMDKSKLPGLQRIDTPQKLEAFLWGTMGADRALQIRSSGVDKGSPWEYKKALELWPDFLQSLMNLRIWLNNDRQQLLSLSKRVVEVMVNNYRVNTGKPAVGEVTRQMAVEVAKESNFFANEVYTYSVLFSSLDRYEEALDWLNVLIDADIDYLGSKSFEAGQLLFKMDRFADMRTRYKYSLEKMMKDAGCADKSREERGNCMNEFSKTPKKGFDYFDWRDFMFSLQDKLHRAHEESFVARIILGVEEISIMNFYNNYGNPDNTFKLDTLELLFNGIGSFSNQEADDKLRSWSGCPDMVKTLTEQGGVVIEDYCYSK